MTRTIFRIGIVLVFLPWFQHSTTNKSASRDKRAKSAKFLHCYFIRVLSYSNKDNAKKIDQSMTFLLIAAIGSSSQESFSKKKKENAREREREVLESTPPLVVGQRSFSRFVLLNFLDRYC